MGGLTFGERKFQEKKRRKSKCQDRNQGGGIIKNLLAKFGNLYNGSQEVRGQAKKTFQHFERAKAVPGCIVDKC